MAYLEIGKDEHGRPKVDQKQLVLTSPLVPSPRQFRYAWGRSPLANVQALGNKDLPFATQRSDDWGMGDVPLGVLGEGWDGKAALTGGQTNKVRQALRQEDVRRRVAEAEAVLREHRGGTAGPEGAEEVRAMRRLGVLGWVGRLGGGETCCAARALIS